MEALTIVLKLILLFLFTLICFRLMGYRSIGDMEPLDYVIVLGIGEVMSAPLAGSDLTVLQAMTAIVTLTVLQIGLTALNNRYPQLGGVMDGTPVPVIRNGRLLEENMLRHRIARADIMEELRIKGLRDERDVEEANLEPSGRFSVVLKNEASPVTPRFLEAEPSLLLVNNGRIRLSDWNEGNVDTARLAAFLAAEGIRDWSEVESLIYKNGRFQVEKR